jgi:hypothetical protein
LEISFYVKGKSFVDCSTLDEAIKIFNEIDGLPIHPERKNQYREMGYKYNNECGTVLILDENWLNISANYKAICSLKFLRVLSTMISNSNIDSIDKSLRKKFNLIHVRHLGICIE